MVLKVVFNLEKFFWNPVKSKSNAGAYETGRGLGGGSSRLHFELFGIVNNKWNFNMELINTQSTKMIVCSFDSKRTFCVCQFL